MEGIEVKDGASLKGIFPIRGVVSVGISGGAAAPIVVSGKGSNVIKTDIVSGSAHKVLNINDATLNYSYAGHIFKGWNTAANGSGQAYTPGDSFNVDANTTLFAQWEPQSETKPDPDPDSSTDPDSGIEPDLGTSPVATQTGDNSNITLFYLLFLISSLSIVVFGILHIKRRRGCEK